MLRYFAVCLLMSATVWAADEPSPFRLAAPAGWGGETIKLPPGFAPEMRLQGLEHIRFAPGMMKPDSDSFFSYTFVFELQPQPALTDAVVKDEFLKYYRGLCKAVLNGQLPDVDPSKFTLKLKRAKSDAKDTAEKKDSSDTQAAPDEQASSEKKAAPDERAADPPTRYTGVLQWVEPFATKKPQKLNLEIRTWAGGGRNYIFACVSPQARDQEIWKQLHTIRDDYLKK